LFSADCAAFSLRAFSLAKGGLASGTAPSLLMRCSCKPGTSVRVLSKVFACGSCSPGLGCLFTLVASGFEACWMASLDVEFVCLFASGALPEEGFNASGGGTATFLPTGGAILDAASRCCCNVSIISSISADLPRTCFCCESLCFSSPSNSRIRAVRLLTLSSTSAARACARVNSSRMAETSSLRFCSACSAPLTAASLETSCALLTAVSTSLNATSTSSDIGIGRCCSTPASITTLRESSQTASKSLQHDP